MLHKIIIIALLSFTCNLYASESEEILSKIKLDHRTIVVSYMKLNKHGRFYAQVAKKRNRRGIDGCRHHIGTMSTNLCRVSIEKVRIHNLSVNDEGEIVFDDGVLNTVCGRVQKSRFGKRIRLNDFCKLIDEVKVLEVDDDVEIKKYKFAITKFIVRE